MTRIERLVTWLTWAVTIPERQCELILLEAMRRAGWRKVMRVRVVKRKRCE
jgi:hypothetical protein